MKDLHRNANPLKGARASYNEMRRSDPSLPALVEGSEVRYLTAHILEPLLKVPSHTAARENVERRLSAPATVLS